MRVCATILFPFFSCFPDTVEEANEFIDSCPPASDVGSLPPTGNAEQRSTGPEHPPDTLTNSIDDTTSTLNDSLHSHTPSSIELLDVGRKRYVLHPIQISLLNAFDGCTHMC